MDYQQWRNQSEEHSAEIPQLPNLTGSALPLFAPEPNTKRTTFSTSFPRMGSLFSLAQWQELELQAQIYKYMMAGASVPSELIHPLKTSPVTSSPYYHYQHFQPSVFQSGYWGRCIADPEPGRCRRTDGKKWRCSKDVVAGQKYCERHVHRGRSRSRKLVEIPTSNVGSGFKAARARTTLSPLEEEKKETHFTLSGTPSTLHISPPDQRSPDGKGTQGNLPQRRDGRVLMRFFDDWPSSEKHGIAINDHANSISSSTRLSISIPDNSTSDVPLKLSTGNTDNWSLWGNRREEGSMGGPLAEALRSSSTSSPSPTSVFQKPNGSVSEASSATT